jgi:hypothetical protein
MDKLLVDLEEANDFNEASLNDVREPCYEFFLLVGGAKFSEASYNSVID